MYLTIVYKTNTGEYLSEEFLDRHSLDDYLKAVAETANAELVFFQEKSNYLQ